VLLLIINQSRKLRACSGGMQALCGVRAPTSAIFSQNPRLYRLKNFEGLNLRTLLTGVALMQFLVSIMGIG
jgi:hypothetical protein